MRPKKRILLIDANEDRMGVLGFVLIQHGYFVSRAQPGREAEQTAKLWSPGVIVRRGPQGEFFLSAQHSGRREELPAQAPASAVLEQLRILAAVKRGPRKGYQRKPPASVAAVSSNRLTAERTA